MKAIWLTAAALIAIVPANAQVGERPQTTGSARFGAPVPYEERHYPRSEPLECLLEKATGREFCKTRSAWRRIALRIEQGKTWR